MRVVDAPSRPVPGLDAKRDGPRPGERGFCGLKSLLWLAIMCSFIYVCFQAGPYFVSEYQLQDAMKTIARFASVNRMTPDDIRSAVMKEAVKDDVPLQPQDIKVSASSGNVKIDASYRVTVDLHFYQWQLNFNPSATNNALF